MIILTLKNFIEMSSKNQDELIDAVNCLSDEQRLQLRNKLIENGVKKIPSNLFYNYVSQKWIEDK